MGWVNLIYKYQLISLDQGVRDMETNIKKQVIVCHKGKCSDEGIVETGFDSLFSGSDVVNKIQRELFNNMIK